MNSAAFFHSSLDGDSKFVEANGPKSQTWKHHFWYWKTLKCRTRVHETPNRGTILKRKSLWTKEQPKGHQVSSIGTGMKENYGEKVHRNVLVIENNLQWGGSSLKYTQEKGVFILFKHHWLFKKMGTIEFWRRNCYWWTLQIHQDQNICVVDKVTTTNAQVYHLCTSRHCQNIMNL